jgi:hypothetical protein
MEKNDTRLVVALSSALGLALLVIAFLLGRLLATPAAVTITAPPSNITASEPIPPAPATAPASLAAVTENGDLPIPVTERADFPGPATEIAQNSAAEAPRSSAAAERPQITSYFAQIERLSDMGAGDPQAFANSMLQSVTSGDFSGFDDLLSKARSQRQRLLSVTPPPACREYHRLALTLSGDSVAMLERLRTALGKGDTTALMTMATEGRTLEIQANQLKSMGEGIKQQAGLP